MAKKDTQLHNRPAEDPVSVAQRWSDETLLKEIDSLLEHEVLSGYDAAQLTPVPKQLEAPQPEPKAPEAPQPEAQPEPQSASEQAPQPASEQAPSASEQAIEAQPVPDDGMRPEDLPDILSYAPQVKTPKPQNLQEPEPEPQSAPKPKKQKPPKPAPRVKTPEEACRDCAAGLGGLGLCIVVLRILELLSVFLTLYADLGWSFLSTLFGGSMLAHLLLILLILMLALSFNVFSEALRALARGEFPQDVLLTLAALFALIDSFGAASAGRTPFTAALGLLLLLRLWGGCNRRLACLETLRLLRDSAPAVGIVDVQLSSETRRGITRAKPSLKDFMQQLETPDAVRRAMGVYTPIAALLCIAGAALIARRADCGYFWAGTLLFLGAVPTASLMSYERVYFLLSKRLHAARAALCGWHGASVFGGEHAVLVGDDDLFPEGSLSLNGFKVYQGNPERLIAYAAAAARCSGGALFPLFDALLDAHSGRHYTVDKFRFYDSGGVGAQIRDDIILLGSLDFMQRMGVHMDGGSKVRQAAYLSLNGELAAVFAIKYNAPSEVKQGLLSVARSRYFRIVLATRSFLATPEFIKGKFGLPPDSVSFPPVKDRLRLSGSKLKKTGAQGALLCRDSFLGYAGTVAAGRLLRAVGRAGALLSVLGGLLGLGLMAVLAVLPAFEAATALNLLLYVLVWLVPTALLCLWARRL